ncbi:MAG: CUAEP/CCAEP-tail radical SAM protein, partial [Alphaproteobacteria bacterium]
MKVVLISTFDLGHQPFGLASPAAWLSEAGASVSCIDLAVEDLDERAVREAGLIAVYLPMHTATRLASAVAPRLKRLNPTAHLGFYGLYAPLNADFLRGLGAETILGGEFESG